MVPQVFYDLCSGTGRVRGSLDGLRQTRSWRLLFCSTGESPGVANTQDGGSRARVITITRSALPKGSDTQVKALRNDLLAHYGHAGPAFIAEEPTIREYWAMMAGCCVSAPLKTATSSPRADCGS